MPSRPYCASRTCRLESYRRPVVHCCTGSLSGTSASSSSSGTRPTSARQTANPKSAPKRSSFSRSGDPSAVRHPGDGQVVRLVREPVLLLPPRHVEPLAEVAAAVEEPDPHHGQRLVARLLDDVAREHAEPARVEGQRRVHAELGAQERDRAGDAGARLVRPREIRRHVLGQRLDPRDERRVALRRRLRRRPEVVQEAHRVVPGALPAEGADVAEERGPVRVPAPAVVVRDGGERLQPVDEAVRQRSRAARQVLRAEPSECRPHGSRLPHACARPRDLRAARDNPRR